MDPVEAIVLGCLQGLTEFLPVSSSGHLAVGQMLLGLREGNLVLSVVLHAGTLLATLLFFRRRIARISEDLVVSLSAPRQILETEGGQDALTIIVASIPTAIMGLSGKGLVEVWTTQPVPVACGFLLTAGLLMSSRFILPGERLNVTAWGAVLVGVAQGVAIAPGVSRSGATIVTLLWMGVRSARAFELSMLISLPAVFGALLLELPEALRGSAPLPLLVLGAAVSFAVGWVALGMLRGVVTRGRMAWFTAWVFPLALLTFWAPGG